MCANIFFEVYKVFTIVEKDKAKDYNFNYYCSNYPAPVFAE